MAARPQLPVRDQAGRGIDPASEQRPADLDATERSLGGRDAAGTTTTPAPREQPGLNRPSAIVTDWHADFLRLTADWVWETDAQLNFVMVSQRVMNAVGRAPQELIGTNLMLLCASSSRANEVKRRFDRLSPFREQAFEMLDSEGRSKTFLLS